MKASTLGLMSVVGLMASLAAATVVAAAWPEERIVYSYDYFADPEMTQYLGTVTDPGCEEWGENERARRVQVPSPYFTKTALYVCSGGPFLPGDF